MSGVVPLSSARSAGLLFYKAADVASKQNLSYWKTGTTFTLQSDIASANLLNPTFAYSLGGEGCNVHYGTDPLTPFHFAALFGNSAGTPTISGMVDEAKSQFENWCTAFQDAAVKGTVRVRFLLAEVTAACRAFRIYSATDTLNAGIPVAQFRTTLLRLDKTEYVDDRAPASFNVIETSNLVDHIGLFNILVSVIPLMSPSPSSVLYTESLLLRGVDATKEFKELLYADIGTMGLLLDLSPIDYLSGFSTRSNIHELIMHQPLGKNQKQDLRSTGLGQYHQVHTWKRPSSCDSVLALRSGRSQRPSVFEPSQLGTLLFDIYQAMFTQEDALNFAAQNQQNILRAIASSNLIHYMRESFVLFLKLVRERLQIPNGEWLEAMGRMFELESTDTTMSMNTVNRNDFYAHLHRQGVYSVDYYKNGRIQRIGRFSGWDHVPPVVRIVLSVPRERITHFEDVLEKSGVGTPPMQCHIIGSWSMNTFSAVHVGYGRVLSVGTKANPRVLFDEDPDGHKGSLPLVVSFVISAMLLTDIEPPQQLRVSLGVRSTTGTVPLHRALGISLEVYSAGLMDEEHVFVLPEPTVPSASVDRYSLPVISPNATLNTQIGTQDTVMANLDEQCELVSTLVARVDLEDDGVIRDFAGGAMPEIVQHSPCVMRLNVAGYVQDVVFPFPVVGSQNKLRLARKSRYIEVRIVVKDCVLKVSAEHSATCTRSLSLLRDLS